MRRQPAVASRRFALVGAEPRAYLTDVLTKIASGWPRPRLDEMLPRHAATQPDDALHAQLFGWLAWKVLTADLRFY